MAIQLSFISEHNPFSWVVRAWTWSRWSHVDIIVPAMYYPEFPSGGYLGARMLGGVKLRPFGYIKPVQQAIGTIECTAAQEAAILAYAMRQRGKKYDFLNILGEGLHEDWSTEPDRWICSVLVWAAFHNSGINLVNPENVDRPTPGDLARSALVDLKIL